MNADYWHKIREPNFDKIYWNVPEQKTGSILVVGGNSQSFATEIKCGELLSEIPFKDVELLFPDALRGKIPPLPGISYAPSTESGSFKKSIELEDAFTSHDVYLISGDLSKNSATGIAVSDAITKSVRQEGGKIADTQSPIIITRDAVDLVTPGIADIITRPGLTLVCSMVQLQKVFRSILYPKMIMLSMPIFPIVETLHKFTLSYSLTIVTFQAGQIIIAKDGEVSTIPIDRTSYTPLSLWSGTLAGKIAALELWNPNDHFDAAAAAVFWNHRQKSGF